MSWIDEAIGSLKSMEPCGYHSGDPSAAETESLAALALLGAGDLGAAQNHLNWLADKQSTSDGSVPPYANLQWPGWSTPLAIMAMAVAQSLAESPPGEQSRATSNFNFHRAKDWLLSTAGSAIPKTDQFGHDGMLIGWPWVMGTHSWQEPTAWSVLSLKALELGGHPRTREGVRMLIDRLLPTGGCNYGNTYVLGQRLRAQVEPTGLTMIALAGERSDDPRIAYSIQYLNSALSAETTSISLSYGLLGLAAHKRTPAECDHWLEAGYRRTIARGGSALAIALLVLAAQGKDCPLIKFTSVNLTAGTT